MALPHRQTHFGYDFKNKAKLTTGFALDSAKL